MRAADPVAGAPQSQGVRHAPATNAFERWKERLQNACCGTLLWVLGIVGFLLLADGLRYFEFFGLVEIPGVP